jgi:PST family polysaccharide transporter
MAAPAGQLALAQQVKAGLRWSLLNTMLTRGGNFIAGVVLARILAPKDFGVYAVALVVMQLLLALNDVGISAPIVRWQGDVEDILPTGMTAVLLVSGLLYAALFTLAPVYCGAVHAPQAVGVVRLLGLTVIIDAVFSMPSLILTRTLRQDRRVVSDLTKFVVATVITILMATHGFGAWSLAWGQLIGNLAGGVVILVVTRQRIRVGFQKEAAKHLLTFGLPLTGSSLLLFAMLNVDNIIVGRVLGTTALGFYVLAFNLSGWLTPCRSRSAGCPRLDCRDYLETRLPCGTVLFGAWPCYLPSRCFCVGCSPPSPTRSSGSCMVRNGCRLWVPCGSWLYWVLAG